MILLLIRNVWDKNLFIIIAWYNYLIIHVHVNDGQVNLFSIDISYNIIKWKSFLHWSYTQVQVLCLVHASLLSKKTGVRDNSFCDNTSETSCTHLVFWNGFIYRMCYTNSVESRELVHGGPIFVVLVGSTPPWLNLHPRRKQNIWVGFLT